MLRVKWALAGSLVAILAAIIAGCANVKPTRTGYLSDYSKVQADRDNHKFEIHYANADALQEYDSFYIEDVAWKSPRPKKVAADPERQTALLNSLRQALEKQLATIKPVVNGPGPRTARVRAAITDEVDSSPILNVLMTIVAVPVINGGASVEAEVIAPDGHQLAAVSGAKAGGIFDMIGYYLPQDHAKQAFRKAARELQTALIANAPAPGVVEPTPQVATGRPQDDDPPTR